jgi:hypothetical protein
MRKARSAVVTTQVLPAECHAYRYIADVDDRGGLFVVGSCEHMVRTRGNPDESSSASTA